MAIHQLFTSVQKNIALQAVDCLFSYITTQKKDLRVKKEEQEQSRGTSHTCVVEQKLP